MEATKGSPLVGSSTPFLRKLQLHIASYFLVTKLTEPFQSNAMEAMENPPIRFMDVHIFLPFRSSSLFQ